MVRCFLVDRHHKDLSLGLPSVRTEIGQNDVELCLPVLKAIVTVKLPMVFAAHFELLARPCTEFRIRMLPMS